MAIRVLTATFALFLASASFSIALSQIMLGISALIFIWLLLRDEAPAPYARFRIVWWVVGAYILWEGVTSLLGATPLRSLNLIKEEWLFVAVPIALFLFSDKDRAYTMVASLCVGLICLGTYGALQHIFGIQWYGSMPLIPSPVGGYRVTGFFHHVLTLGNLTATAAVFCIALSWKGRSENRTLPLKPIFLGGVAAAMLTLLTFSRGPILALGAGCLVVAFALPRKLVVAGGVAAVVILSVLVAVSPGLRQYFVSTLEFETSGTSVMSRQVIWKTTGTIIADYPLFGVGAGNFKSVYGPRLPSDAPARAWHTHPHNDLLNVIATHGIPGGLLFVALWWSVLRQFLRGTRRDSPLAFAALAASVTFLITGLTEATFADEEVRQVLMAIWGIGLAESAHVDYDLPNSLDTTRQKALS